MDDFPVVLKRRRRELGLTISQIAREMNVAAVTVQRWESGKTKSMHIDKIIMLAKILKVPPDVLLNPSETTHPMNDSKKW